jgi:hypothetical protein
VSFFSGFNVGKDSALSVAFILCDFKLKANDFNLVGIASARSFTLAITSFCSSILFGFWTFLPVPLHPA